MTDETKDREQIKDLPVADVANDANVQGGLYNAYVQVGDIKGESTEQGHSQWIEILGS